MRILYIGNAEEVGAHGSGSANTYVLDGGF
jgi:hypothetical protein